MGYRPVEFFLGYPITEEEIRRCLEGHDEVLSALPDDALPETRANAVLEASGTNARVCRVFREPDKPDAFILRLRKFISRPYEMSSQGRVFETDKDRAMKARLGISGSFVFQAFA